MKPSNDNLWERPLRWSQLSATTKNGLLIGGAFFILLVGGLLVELMMTGG
jgi:hypothetical protein